MKNSILKFVTLLVTTLLMNCEGPMHADPPIPFNSSTVNNLACKKILIDASHDGGVWWFPQGESGLFSPSEEHQGKMLADDLRKKGFVVDELSRGVVITDEVLKDYSIIIRVNGYGSYSESELEAYQKSLNRGITLLLIADYITDYSPNDGLAEALNVKFDGKVGGYVTGCSSHPMAWGINNIVYRVGSLIANVQQNSNIQIIGTLSGGSPVMAILKHPSSNIFLMGDSNTMEADYSIFANNITSWVSQTCGPY